MSDYSSMPVEKKFPHLSRGFRSLSGNPNLGVWEINESNFIFAIPLRPRPRDCNNVHEFDKGIQFYVDDNANKIMCCLWERKPPTEPAEYSKEDLFAMEILVDPRGNLSCRIPGFGEQSLENFVRGAADYLEGYPRPPWPANLARRIRQISGN